MDGYNNCMYFYCMKMSKKKGGGNPGNGCVVQDIL